MNSKEKKSELKKITGVSVSFMAVALLFSSVFSGDKVERTTLWAKSATAKDVDIVVNAATAPVSLDTDIKERAQSDFLFDRSKMSDNYVVIPKQSSENGLATITDEYVYRTVYVDIATKIDGFYNKLSVLRYSKDKEFKGEPEKLVFPPYLEAFLKGKTDVGDEEMEAYEALEKGNKKQKNTGDPIVNIELTRINNIQPKVRFELTFDKLYVPELFEDDENYYISLRRPKDVYSKILVVDIGHGGRDAGTFSGDRRIFEKDTVLDFGLKLKELFDKQDDIKVYFTRLSDVYLYRRPRADLANGLDADFFLSIHNNNYTVMGMPINFNEVRGSEIHYNEKVKSKKVSSKRFATLILDNICKAINTKKRGVVEGSELYVLGHTVMPSALLEIGFLTNKDDLKIIQNNEKMDACAKAVYDAVLQAFKENEE